MSDLGKRIREKREFLGLTQEELAMKLGYKNKSTIAKIENGTNDIVQSKVVEFANVLGTTPAYLMGWETTENTFAENITENRRRLKLTYGELAEKLGVQASNVIAWEGGDKRPNRQMIDKMCQIFGKTYDEMYGLSKSSDDEIVIESNGIKLIISEAQQLSEDSQKRLLAYAQKLRELEELEK